MFEHHFLFTTSTEERQRFSLGSKSSPAAEISAFALRPVAKYLTRPARSLQIFSHFAKLYDSGVTVKDAIDLTFTPPINASILSFPTVVGVKVA